MDYYACLKKPKSNREIENEKLLIKIQEFHKERKEIYGSPRIFQDLIDANISCSLNRVARLMQKNNMQAKKKKAFIQLLSVPVLF